MRRRRTCRLYQTRRACEALEPRVVLAAYGFDGTAGGDTFVVRDASDGAVARVGVRLNGGEETIQVVDAGDTVTLSGLGGADAFEVAGTVAGVMVFLDGGTGADTLFYDDGGESTEAVTIDVGPSSIDRVAGGTEAGPVRHLRVETVRIDMNDGAGVLRVFGTAAGVTTYAFAGGGDDTLDVYPRRASAAGPGLGPPSLEGALHWAGEVGAGDRVRVQDADGQAPLHYHFHADAVAQVLDGLGASVHIGDSEQLVLNAGAAADTFVLGDGTLAGGASGEIRVNGGGGNDAVEYRDQETFRGGDPVETYTIDPDSFTHAVDDGAPTTRAVVHYAAVESLRIVASRNDTRFLVRGTGAALTLDAGDGDDDTTVGDGSLDGVEHLVTVDGGPGFNTLRLVDTGDPTADVVHVGAAGIGLRAGDTLFPPGGGVRDAGMYAVTLDLPDAAAGDRVYVVPRAGVTIHVNGGLPGSQPSGDALTLALAGVTSPVHTPGAPGSGQYTFGNRWPVIYTSVEERAVDADAPVVVGAVFRFDLPRPALDLTFSEDVGDSLDAGEVHFSNADTGEPFPASGVVMTYDGATHTARFHFPGFAGGILPDGNYRVAVDAGGVTDAAGNVAASAWDGAFFAFAGDANHDRAVDFFDLVKLAQNYNTTGKTFADGDFNYDTAVDFFDLVTVAQRYRTALAPPPGPADAAALPGDGRRDGAGAGEPPVFSTVPVARRAPTRRGPAGFRR